MAADLIAGYIDALLGGAVFKRSNYALDRESRKAAVNKFFQSVANDTDSEDARLAA